MLCCDEQLRPASLDQAFGIGGPAMIPTIPPIMNAIFDTLDVRIPSLPAAPEKALEAIKCRRG
jgi:CO/xanthine dehydrogenase Mo-binding subunit